MCRGDLMHATALPSAATATDKDVLAKAVEMPPPPLLSPPTPTMSSTTAPPRKPTASESLFCGVVAGCIEGGLTYPAEYVKTKMQSPGQAVSPRCDGFRGELTVLQNRGIVAMIVDTVKTRGVAGLYAGAGAQIAGTGLKAGVRFMTYDTFKEMLRTDEVGWGSGVVAGC